MVTVEVDDYNLPSTWEEFCKGFNIKQGESYISSYSTVSNYENKRKRNFTCDRNCLPSEKAATQHLALMQLHQLRDCYRQGWVPDWNEKRAKFAISPIDRGNYVIDELYTVPAFLSFQSRKIAELFLANFLDLIREAGELL